MATPPNSRFYYDNNNNNTPIKNRDISTVYLEEWWLMKAEKEVEGKRLAIGGLTLREKRAPWIFSSAPIIKRHDVFTLKAADGMTISIKGQINTSRTLENGVPSEVCSHFMLGFPYNWETYADLSIEKEPTGRGVPTSMSGFDESTIHSSLADCLGGKAVTKTLIHLISSLPASVLTKDIADLLEKCSGHDLENPTVPISASMKSSDPVMGDSLPKETFSDENSKSERNHGHDKGLLHAIEEETVDNEDNLLSNKQDNLNSDGFNNESDSKVLKGNYFTEKLENSIAATGNVREDGGIDDKTMENEENISPHKQDFLYNDGSNGLESEVLEENTFKENIENSTDDIPVQHRKAEVLKSSYIEPISTKETLIDKEDGGIDKETTENEVNIPSHKQEFLNNDRSNETGSKVLKRNSFKEKEENSSADIPVLHLNAEVVKSSDREPLATKEALADGEDDRINDKFVEIKDNPLSNNQDNLNHDGCNQPESEVLIENSFKEKLGSSTDDIPLPHLNAEAVKPSHIDPLAIKEILTGQGDAQIVTLSNTSKRTTRSSVKNLRNYDTASEGFKQSGNNGEDKVRIVGGSKSKRTKLCSLALQDFEADMISVIELTGSAGGNSTSPDFGVTKFSSKILKCNDIKTKHALRNQSTSIASDVKYDNPSKVNNVLPVDLKSSSEKLECSKCSQNDSNKTKSSLRSERSANLSCHYDTGNDESSKSIGSDAKNVCLNEVNIDVPVDISSSYTTTLSYQTKAKSGVKKRKSGRLKRKQTGSSSISESSSSISESQGSVVVPGLCVERLLTHGSNVSVERILEKSSSKTPYVESPEISDRAGNCSSPIMEDSTAHRNLESNVNCTTEVSMDTINIMPDNAATKTTTNYRFKNIEGGVGKNTASNCWVEDENNVCTATSEATKKPGRKHLTTSCASNHSSHKIDRVKEFGSLSEGRRRTSSRLKNLANKWKEDNPTNWRLDFKGNKVNSDLMGSDFVKSDEDKVDCEPGGRSALDQPKMGLQETHPGTELENQEKGGSYGRKTKRKALKKFSKHRLLVYTL